VGAAFRWGSLGLAPGILIEVTLTKGYRSRLVKGLFDTGADFTHVRQDWKDRLRVPDSECVPWEIRVADGHVVEGQLTVIDATFDEHTFRMPVVFSPFVPTDLIGRIGIFDQFKIEQDPKNATTVFTWVGPVAEPWSAAIERQWKDRLSKKPSSKDAPT